MYPLHVLVIDDDAAELEKISQALSQAGYRVSTRANTFGVRADILALRPDLVLMDPSSSHRGEDLTFLLGLHPETADIPIVLHTRTAPSVRRPGVFGAIQKGSDLAAFLSQFQRMANDCATGGLPKEDRAVIAERHLSGTHRLALPKELRQDPASGTHLTAGVAPPPLPRSGGATRSH